MKWFIIVFRHNVSSKYYQILELCNQIILTLSLELILKITPKPQTKIINLYINYKYTDIEDIYYIHWELVS